MGQLALIPAFSRVVSCVGDVVVVVVTFARLEFWPVGPSVCGLLSNQTLGGGTTPLPGR